MISKSGSHFGSLKISRLTRSAVGTKSVGWYKKQEMLTPVKAAGDTMVARRRQARSFGASIKSGMVLAADAVFHSMAELDSSSTTVSKREFVKHYGSELWGPTLELPDDGVGNVSSAQWMQWLKASYKAVSAEQGEEAADTHVAAIVNTLAEAMQQIDDAKHPSSR